MTPLPYLRVEMGDEALEEDVSRALERKEGREMTAAERMTRERSLSTEIYIRAGRNPLASGRWGRELSG